jgi:hypothetical protein
MKASKVIALLVYMFIGAPIWYYLVYKVLESVNASELMWFLYWVYTPVTILSAIIVKVSGED